MESLPAEIFDSIIVSCDLSALLKLRLVSTRLKDLVDGSRHFRDTLQTVKINLDISTLPKFMEQASGLPFTNFSLDTSHPETKDTQPLNLYNPTTFMETFIERVCPEIRTLRVSTMFGCTSNPEFDFFKSLKSLRELEIGCLVAGMGSIPEDNTAHPANKDDTQSPRIPWINPNLLLKRLDVDTDYKSGDYFLELIKSCPSLEILKLPKGKYASSGLLASILQLGGEDYLQHLRTLDTSFQSIGIFGCSSEQTKFILKIMSDSDFRLDNVSPIFYVVTKLVVNSEKK